MSRDVTLLNYEFRENVEKLLVLCKKDGYEMKPFYTLRSPQEQAKLFRQSRPFSEIKAAGEALAENGAPYLASVLMNAGPQSGKWATNALPGFSWHQHGEAVDCYWIVGGKAEWSTKKTISDENGYIIYARNAAKLGLEPGHFWTHKDSVHVQKNKDSVLGMIRHGIMTYKNLDEKMQEMFST